MLASNYVIALDQDTLVTRCLVFDRDGSQVASSVREHEQITPQSGYVEHNAMEIWTNTRLTIAEVLALTELVPSDVAAFGISNQRDTIVVWDKTTGEPIYNAIAWQDTRTQDICAELAQTIDTDAVLTKTGIPLSTFAAAPKIKWILDNVEGAREKAEAGTLLAGSMDSWLIWNLTGGARGSVDGPAAHITDVTNASRSMLMDLTTLTWDEDLCNKIGIPLSILPSIGSSSAVLGHIRRRGPLPGVPIAGVMGDQQASALAEACLTRGSVKNSFGTGSSALMNVGTDVPQPTHGLLATVFYRIGQQAPVYALEGITAASSLSLSWLCDNLHLADSIEDIEKLADEVSDNGGVYFVPAFTGLLSPHWNENARGTIAGLTRFANKHHLARAAMEATAYQTCDVIDAMMAATQQHPTELRVDGRLTLNTKLMQFLADILGITVIRTGHRENAALGAAYAAGLTVKFWNSLDDIAAQWHSAETWEPHMPEEQRNALYRMWNKAVTRSFDQVNSSQK